MLPLTEAVTKEDGVLVSCANAAGGVKVGGCVIVAAAYSEAEDDVSTSGGPKSTICGGSAALITASTWSSLDVRACSGTPSEATISCLAALTYLAVLTADDTATVTASVATTARIAERTAPSTV
jgi:hypothetical protein